MITGQIKNQIDQIWDTFWNAGITNSLTVLEQMTYLFFMKMLDDAQINKEAIANSIGLQVKEHYSGELKKKANAEHFRNTMLHGFDTDATMLRIGAMNLMLHGVDNPTVEYRDSLSEDNTDADRYSHILANPPFAGSLDNESVAKSLLSISKTKKTELLFLSLFVRSLRVGGRCASIVPDGVLTGSSKAHVALRRELVDNQRLVAVISMPSGVFKPYSGVSTGILIFTKTNSGGTDRVWFYDMKADGLSLDDKRNPVADNDIPDVIARFRAPEDEVDRSRTDQSFFVPVEEIRDHGYDLSFNTYKETVREAVHYDSPQVIIARIEERQRAFDAAFAELKKLLNS